MQRCLVRRINTNTIKMDVSNTAKTEGIEKGEDRKDNRTVYKESKSSAGVIKSNTFNLVIR